MNIKILTKGDFDNNGYCDLLAISRENRAFCILDSGVNKFYIKPLTNRLGNPQFFTVSKDKKLINYFQTEWFRTTSSNPDSMYQSYTKKGTLIYKFDCFIENNETPKKNNIQSIEYSKGGLNKRCTSFDLKINADRTMVYQPYQYTKLKTGIYRSKIADMEIMQLFDCLNYMDSPNLQDNYQVNWTDDASSALKITYDNGKIKTINDYGLIGTFGLEHINDILLDLAENHTWQ